MNVNSVLFIVVKKGCPTSSSTWHKLIGWKRNYAKSTGCLHSHIQSTSHSDLIEIAKVKYHEVVTGIFFSLDWPDRFQTSTFCDFCSLFPQIKFSQRLNNWECECAEKQEINRNGKLLTYSVHISHQYYVTETYIQELRAKLYIFVSKRSKKTVW